MENDRYQPPKSGFEKTPRGREPGSLIQAVLLGSATDIGGTFVISVALGVVYSVVLAAQGLSDAEMQAAFKNIDPWSFISLLGMALGLTMSAVGGYVCARTANVATYTAIGMMSAISVAYGTYAGKDDTEWPVLLLLNMLSFLAVFVGGWWYIRNLAPRA